MYNRKDNSQIEQFAQMKNIERDVKAAATLIALILFFLFVFGVI